MLYDTGIHPMGSYGTTLRLFFDVCTMACRERDIFRKDC